LVAAVDLAASLVAAPGPPGVRLWTGRSRTRHRSFWPIESTGPADDTAPSAGRGGGAGLRWVDTDQAAGSLASGSDRRVLRAFLADRTPRRPVVLVRHARAGKRGRWGGPDEERPLDRRGRAQAAALARLLAGYQVEGIHSSTARRCLETVAPLAEAVSVPVQTDPLLGEVAALGDREGARTTLLRVVQQSGTVVVCGQRKSLDIALPALLDSLGVRGPVSVPRKGGLLVLHVPLQDGRTVVETVEPLA
jgi:8-oxo-dGTP diphosphatase